VVSILLMFVLHQLQLIQDRLVLDCQNYCDEKMLRHLQVPDRDEKMLRHLQEPDRDAK
jgi:hypothetical protein